MARNGSGTYTKVNTFVSGNTITASGHNQNWDDLATEMTNSVAADGQTNMTGVLKHANGAVGAPSVTFASDTDSGMYRIGADNVGIAVGGSKVLDIAAAGATVTGTFGFTGNFAINTNKFTVTAASGNTLVAGTLDVTGNVAVNTNKFNVTAASGNTTIAGTLGVTSDVAINTNKFTVAASSGNTVVAGTLGVTGDATFTADVSAATISGNVVAAQAGQETGTSTTTVVTPGRQHFHASAAKAWAKFTASTGALTASYNVTSVVRDSQGDWTVTIANDFSGANYAILAMALDTGGAARFMVATAQAAGTFSLKCLNDAAADQDPDSIYFVCFGDL